MVLINEIAHDYIVYMGSWPRNKYGLKSNLDRLYLFRSTETFSASKKESYLDELAGPLRDASCQRGETCPGESQLIKSHMSCRFFNVISISFFLSGFPVLDAQKIHLELINKY